MFQKKDLFTIPNLMGYFRILLVPVFIYLYINAHSRPWLFSFSQVSQTSLMELPQESFTRSRSLARLWTLWLTN